MSNQVELVFEAEDVTMDRSDEGPFFECYSAEADVRFRVYMDKLEAAKQMREEMEVDGWVLVRGVVEQENGYTVDVLCSDDVLDALLK